MSADQTIDDPNTLIPVVLAAYEDIADRFLDLLGLHQQMTAAIMLSDLDEFLRIGKQREKVFDDICMRRGNALPLVERWFMIDVPQDARDHYRYLLVQIDIRLEKIGIEQGKHARRMAELDDLRASTCEQKGGDPTA